MNTKIIQIKCKGHINVPLEKFKDLQGNLKSLSDDNLQKLKNSILDKGFLFPFFAWKDKENYYIIDAHQRNKVLTLLESEGYLIDPLPTVLIDCKDRREAKENLLLLNSRYGEITQSGFDSFINELNYEIDLSNMNQYLEMPDIIDFKSNLNIDDFFSTEINLNDKKNIDKIICPYCKKEFEK